MSESDLQSKLRFSEARYRRLFEAAQDGIMLLNADTAEIEDVNPFLIDLLGYSHAEFLGKKLWDIGAFKDASLSKASFLELQTKHYIRYDDLPLETKDGRRISVEFVSNLYGCNGTDVIQCNIRDNTKRHIAEMMLRATARELQMLSESNIALLNAKTENELFDEYCRIAVETGGYRMAWVGIADQGPDQRIIPLAHSGSEEGYLQLADISWADTERGNGPVGRCIRTGQAEVVEDISTDPVMAPWRTEALRRGFRSTIAVPFRLPDATMACLALYGATSDLWSAPERKLLQEMSDDLAFGVGTLRMAIARTQYQETLRSSLEQTIQVVAGTIAEKDLYTAGHQRRVAHLSARIATELGLPADRVHALHLAATIHDLGKIGIPAEILSKPRELSVVEFGLVKEHPQVGFNILKDVVFPWPIAEMILQHHERIDGSGYPRGLTGDDMLLEAKILGVADVVEAMASHRPYRAALGIEAALSEISSLRGVAFDADVVDACLRLFREQGYEIVD